MAEYLQVQGLAELRAKFQALPAEIATKVLRKGVAAAAIKLRATARTAAPIGHTTRRRSGGATTAPGVLRQSAIVRYMRADSNATQILYVVTFRKGKRLQRSGRDAFYAGWVEFGHKIVARGGKLRYGAKQKYTSKTARRAASSGSVAGRRFLTGTFNADGRAAATTMADVFSREFRKLYA